MFWPTLTETPDTVGARGVPAALQTLVLSVQLAIALQLPLCQLLVPLPQPEVSFVSLSSEKPSLQCVILNMTRPNTQTKLFLQAPNTIRLSE